MYGVMEAELTGSRVGAGGSSGSGDWLFSGGGERDGSGSSEREGSDAPAASEHVRALQSLGVKVYTKDSSMLAGIDWDCLAGYEDVKNEVCGRGRTPGGGHAPLPSH